MQPYHRQLTPIANSGDCVHVNSRGRHCNGLIKCARGNRLFLIDESQKRRISNYARGEDFVLETALDFMKIWTQGNQESEFKLKSVLLDGLDSAVLWLAIPEQTSA